MIDLRFELRTLSYKVSPGSLIHAINVCRDMRIKLSEVGWGATAVGKDEVRTLKMWGSIKHFLTGR